MKWVETTGEEVMGFIGVIIAMGFTNLPELDDYWMKRGILHMPWFSAVMSSRRFKQLLCYLHLADNSTTRPRSDPHYNKIFKLGPFPE